MFNLPSGQLLTEARRNFDKRVSSLCDLKTGQLAEMINRSQKSLLESQQDKVVALLTEFKARIKDVVVNEDFSIDGRLWCYASIQTAIVVLTDSNILPAVHHNLEEDGG